MQPNDNQDPNLAPNPALGGTPNPLSGTASGSAPGPEPASIPESTPVPEPAPEPTSAPESVPTLVSEPTPTPAPSLAPEPISNPVLEPTPKKKNTGLLIGLVVGLIVLVGAVVAVLLLTNGNTQNSSGTTPTDNNSSNEGGDTGDNGDSDNTTDIDLQVQKRDTERRNEMSHMTVALVRYQTDHSDSPVNLPDVESAVSWTAPSDESFGNDGCRNNEACKLVRDYMNEGEPDNDYKLNEFKDPDGSLFNVVITPNWASKYSAAGAEIGNSSLGENDDGNYTIVDGEGGSAFDEHVVYIIPGGECVGDAATKSTKRSFAILYRLESGDNYCIND